MKAGCWRVGGQEHSWYLVDLMPAVLVLAAHGGMLMEQQLTAVRVAPDDGSVVQGCEAVAVFIIRGGSKLQKGLEKHQMCGHCSHSLFRRESHTRERSVRVAPRAKADPALGSRCLSCASQKEGGPKFRQ